MSAREPVDLEKLSRRLQAATTALGEPARDGDLVMKPGRIARIDWKLRDVALPGAAESEMLHLNDVVFVERAMKGREKDKQSWLYVYARPGNKDRVVEGWVNSAGVLLDPPEPEATVYFIGAKEKLLNIAAKFYRPADPEFDALDPEVKKKLGNGWKWGEDARFFVAALAYVNRHYKGMIFEKGWTDEDFKKTGGWADIHIKAGHAIWIPKREHLLPLKGRFVSSGSISYELFEMFHAAARAVWEFVVGVPAFVAGLVHGALLAVYDALMDIPELIQLVWKAIKGLFSPVQMARKAKELYDALKDVNWRDVIGEMAADFMDKWDADSTWGRFYFRGEVVGYIMATVALAFLSAGITAAASAAAKGSRLARLIAGILKHPTVRRVAENAVVKKVAEKAEDALKKAKDVQEKLALWKAKRDGLLFKGLRLVRGYDKRMGIPEEHLRHMIDAAKEANVIAIFRANKEAAIPLIRKGAHGKPMWAKPPWKSDPKSGILTAADAKQIDVVHRNGHFVAAGDGYAYRSVPGQATPEKIKVDANFTSEVKEGHVLARDGKPIVGDYDLLGVAPVKSPGRNITVVPDDVEYGNWTGPDVEKYRAAVNRKGRLDEPRVLHGAQDGYGGNPQHMGLTDDTAYAVFPDGRTYVMEGRQAQQEFYDALGRQAKGPDAPVGREGWHLEGDRVVRSPDDRK